MTTKPLLLLTRIVLITLFLFALPKAHASHVSGGHIEYEHIGSDSFLFTLYFYRDCSGINAPTSLSMEFRCTSSTAIYTQNVPISYDSEVSQICSSSLNQTVCNGGPIQGMEFYKGSVVIDLAQYNNTHCSDWVFGYSVSARNPSENGNGGTFYTYTILDNSIISDNSSPNFSGVPLPYMYGTGQYIDYDISMSDPDGDSLVYSLDTALVGYNNPMGYQFGFTPSQPITGISLDSNTGKVTINPVPALTGNNNNYVIVYRVDEYEHGTGTYKGTVIRDFQIVVVPNTNNLPYISGNGLSNVGGATQVAPYHLLVPAGQTFCFDVTFADSNQLDSVFVGSNLSSYMSNYSITTSGSNPVTATICGAFNPLTTGSTNLNFLLIAQDNACPVYGQSTKSIEVDLITGSNMPNQTICYGDSVPLNVPGNNVQWSAISGPSLVTGSNFGCTNCNSTYAKPTATTTYAVQFDVSGYGTLYDTFAINVTPSINPSINGFAQVCIGDSASYSAQATGGSIQYTWSGSNISISNPNSQSTSVQFNVPGQHVLLLTATNGNCSQSVQQNVMVNSLPSINAGNDQMICTMQSAQLNASGGNSYQWSPSAGLSSSSISNPVATPLQTTSYVVSGTDSNGCVNTDTVAVVVQPTYIDGFALDSGGSAITSGMAYMVKYDANLGYVTALDSSQLGSMGDFQFVATTDSVFFKIAPDSASYYPNLLPTYYQLVPAVQYATYFNPTPCISNPITVQALQGTNPGGAGFIGGFVSQGAGRSEPIAGLSVILRNSSEELIAQRTTDSEGSFGFDNLAAGTYYVDVDSWGIDNDLAPIVLLNEGEARDSLQFVLHEKYLELLPPLSVEEKTTSEQVQIYPNPFSNQLQLNSSKVPVSVSIYGTDGRLISVYNPNSTGEMMDVSSLASGSYIIEVQFADETIRQPIVKQ